MLAKVTGYTVYLSRYLYAVLVHRLDKIEHLITLSQQSLYEGRGLCLLTVRGGHEVDVFLLLLHSFEVLLEAGQSCGVIAGLESERV